MPRQSVKKITIGKPMFEKLYPSESVYFFAFGVFLN